MSFGKNKDDSSSASYSSYAGSTFSGNAAVATFGSSTPNAAASSLSNQRSEVFIGKGTKISGSFSFAGATEVEGEIEGDVTALDRFSLGEVGVLKGKLNAAEIVIRGEVKGDIVANKRLSLKKPAKVVGNLYSPIISIEEGVAFEGRCSMSVPAQGGAVEVGTKQGANSQGTSAIVQKVI
jgi:cytoskeletal protein CcmA (bactofilin family)